MKNIVLVLLVFFFSNTHQQYYFPINNDCNLYEQMQHIIYLQQKYMQALSQCFSYPQNIPIHLGKNYVQNNENEETFRGNFGSQQSNNLEDLQNQNRNYGIVPPYTSYQNSDLLNQNNYMHYGSVSPYTSYPYSGSQNPYRYREYLGNSFSKTGYKASSISMKQPRTTNTVKQELPIITEDINEHPNWQYFDNEECGETSTDRIIGGEKADLGQYPWLALIGYRSKSKPDKATIFSCGGTLINSCWVLTAAHCITNMPGTYYVYEIRLGEHILDTDIDCDPLECADKPQDFFPKKIISHETFNTPKEKNDIGLIKLDRSATFSRWVSPICLPRLNLLHENFIGKTGEVAGWGIFDVETHNSSKELLYVKLTGTDLSQCQKSFRKTNIDDNTQICVGGVVGKDSCNGDSGGPLMKVSAVDGGLPKYFIFGVVSFGAKQCGKKPIPAIYTRVGHFLPWVLNHIDKC